MAYIQHHRTAIVDKPAEQAEDHGHGHHHGHAH
jgi:chaperonin GroEL